MYEPERHGQAKTLPPAKLRLVKPSETQLLIAESRALRQRSRELRKDLTVALDQVLVTANRSRDLTANIVKLPETFRRLTERELMVLTLVAGGYTCKQLAWRLGISFKTAVTHRTHIMQKLNIHDAPGLTRFAIRYGLTRA